jgi:tetratricopeptide (TPR) repeat protein
VRSGYAKFKQMRHFVSIGGCLLMLFGCASAPPRHSAPVPAPAQPMQKQHVATPDAAHDASALVMQAEFALNKGDMASAQRDYAKASQTTHDPMVAERALGLALALHKPGEAKAALLRWQALGGDAIGLMQARAQIALDEGRTDDARKLLLKLTATSDKKAWQAFGRVLLGARDVAQAGGLLSVVATPERLPDDPQAWLAMSEMGQKLGKYAYAQDIADAAVKRFHTLSTYTWSASLHADRGENRQAMALYAKAVALKPKDTDLRLAYAGLMAKTGDNAGAQRVLAKGPQDERTFAARAAFAARTKDHSTLRRIYVELKAAPVSVRSKSYYLLGQLAALMKQPVQAVKWLAKVPADDDHGVDAGVQRAILLQQLGKSDKAHAVIAQLSADMQGKQEVERKLVQVDAEIYMRDKRYRQAIAAYTRALALDKSNPDLYYGRGMAHASVGRTDAAIADFRHVLKLRPDDLDAVNALGYTLADANRDLPEARRLLARVHKALPDNAAITDSWGWLQYRLGHLGKAEAALLNSWNAQKDPEVGAHLVRVLIARGKHAQARSVYAVALKLDPDNPRLKSLKGMLKP